VISNAAFHFASYAYTDGGNILIAGRECKFRISGSDAKLTMGTAPQGYFYGAGSSFVVENGAEYSLNGISYSYTKNCSCETMRFCSGANVTRLGNFGTGNTYNTSGTSNRLEVTSGASFTVGNSGYMRVVGNYSELVVDDGTLSVASSLYLGTNGLDNANAKSFLDSSFRIAGSHPSVRIGWNIIMASNAKLVFSLPEGGYDSGFATSDNPVISCGANTDHRLDFRDTAQIVFENAAEFFASHSEKRDYVLIKAFSAAYFASLTPERLAAMSAGFPDGMTLEVSDKQLLLHVHPKRGFVITFH